MIVLYKENVKFKTFTETLMTSNYSLTNNKNTIFNLVNLLKIFLINQLIVLI